MCGLCRSESVKEIGRILLHMHWGPAETFVDVGFKDSLWYLCKYNKQFIIYMLPQRRSRNVSVHEFQR